MSCSPTFQALPGVSTHTCIEFLIFDNPWVQNAALHFGKIDIHQVVERNDKTLGHKALDSVRGLKNTTVVVRAIDGHETSANSGGGVSSTTNNSQVRRDIFDRPDTFDAEASLRDLMEDKRNLAQDYQHVDRERRVAADRVKEKKDRAERLQSEIAGFQRKRKQNLTEAKDLELEAEAMPQDFDESVYEERISAKQSLLDARSRELQRIVAEVEVIEKSHAELQVQIKKLVEKREEVEQRVKSTPPRAFCRALHVHFPFEPQSVSFIQNWGWFLTLFCRVAGQTRTGCAEAGGERAGTRQGKQQAAPSSGRYAAHQYRDR